jgi:dUTPase
MPAAVMLECRAGGNDMSIRNGEKARANINRKRRIAQRVVSRAKRAEAATKKETPKTSK